MTVTVTAADRLEADETARTIVGAWREPYATWDETGGTWHIADDADWSVPGVHKRYRAAMQAALTRCPAAWDHVGAGEAVSPAGFWSRRSVIVRVAAGIITTTGRGGSGEEHRFAVRPAEQDALRRRVDDLLAHAALEDGDGLRPVDPEVWWSPMEVTTAVTVPTTTGRRTLPPGHVLAWDGLLPAGLRLPQ